MGKATIALYEDEVKGVYRDQDRAWLQGHGLEFLGGAVALQGMRAVYLT